MVFRYHPDLIKETWFAKLQRWEAALEAYERKQLETPEDFSLSLGRLRCINALGDYDRASSLAHNLWPGLDKKDHKQAIAAEVETTTLWPTPLPTLSRTLPLPVYYIYMFRLSEVFSQETCGY